MATLLGESFFEISGQGPAPTKDFFQFAVTKTEVIWRWWKISLRSEFRNTKPGEQRESHQDYLDDSRLQSQVSVVFGPRILQYTQALCQGHYDYLERLPDPLLLRILAYLELQDVAQLGYTSHKFRKLCCSEQFWEQVVRGRCNTVSTEVEVLALELGWRTVFFTSKLQLQKQISRRRQRTQLQIYTEPESYEYMELHKDSQAADTEPSAVPDPDPAQLCKDMQRCEVKMGQAVAQGDQRDGRGDWSSDLESILK